MGKTPKKEEKGINLERENKVRDRERENKLNPALRLLQVEENMIIDMIVCAENLF